MEVDVGQIMMNAGGSVITVVAVLKAHLHYLRRDTDNQQKEIKNLEERIRKLENDHAANHGHIE